MLKIVDTKEEGSNLKFTAAIFQLLIPAFLSGLIGFSSFFITLLATNVLYHQDFMIDLGNILLSSVGFLCLFILSFLERGKKNN
jgi:hypothetical protein